MSESIDQTITTSNIYPSLFAKDYPTLCKLLNEKAKAGKSKKLQLENWKRFFKYEREVVDADGIKRTSRGYYIVEVYPNPKPKERNPHTETNIRNLVILEHLLNDLDDSQTISEVYMTTKDLYMLIGVCNEEYYNNKRYAQLKLKKNDEDKVIYKSSIFSNMDFNVVRDFYDEVYRRGKGFIEYLLKNVQRQCNVEMHKTYRVHVNTDKGKRIHRPCTDSECIKINEAKDRTLNTYPKKEKAGVMKALTESDLYLSKKLKEFYEDVVRDAVLQELGIKAFYPEYKFMFTSDIVSKVEAYKANLSSINDYSEFLNKLSIQYHTNKTRKNKEDDNGKLEELLSESPDRSPTDICKENRLLGASLRYESDRELLISKLVSQYEEMGLNNMEYKPSSKRTFAARLF